MDVTYEVLQDVDYEANSWSRGTEHFVFEKGPVKDPDDDHWYVLEYALRPAGLAVREGELPTTYPDGDQPPAPAADDDADETDEETE